MMTTHPGTPPIHPENIRTAFPNDASSPNRAKLHPEELDETNAMTIIDARRLRPISSRNPFRIPLQPVRRAPIRKTQVLEQQFPGRTDEGVDRPPRAQRDADSL